MKPTPDEILNATAEWHKSDSHLSLFEWLGWTWQEYQAWVADDDMVPPRPLLKHDGENNG